MLCDKTVYHAGSQNYNDNQYTRQDSSQPLYSPMMFLIPGPASSTYVPILRNPLIQFRQNIGETLLVRTLRLYLFYWLVATAGRDEWYQRRGPDDHLWEIVQFIHVRLGIVRMPQIRISTLRWDGVQDEHR